MATVLEPTEANVERAADCVRDGGVIVAPSDTNLALTVDPRRPEAIERVYELKDRPREKPLTLFVREPDEWRTYGRHEDPAVVDRLADAFWPGPLNLVLEATDAVPDDRCTRDGTVAIGCLANQVWRDLTARLDGPVAMTSANRSGTVDDDALVDVATAVDHVGDGADYVLDEEPEGTTRASTILDLVGEPSILRRGDLTRGDLREVASFSPD